jgi:hypothetical protein
MAIDGQTRQELVDCWLSQGTRVLLAVEQDVSTNPRDIGSLRAVGEMKGPSGHPHPVKELGATRVSVTPACGRRLVARIRMTNRKAILFESYTHARSPYVYRKTP